MPIVTEKSEQKSWLACFRMVEPPTSPPASARAPEELQRSPGVAGLMVVPSATLVRPRPKYWKWECHTLSFESGMKSNWVVFSVCAARIRLVTPAGVGEVLTRRSADQMG